MEEKLMLSFLLLLDNSGSMYGEKICALNFAVTNLILSFQSILEPETQMAIITFGGVPVLHTPFTPVQNINFQPIEARGRSSLTEGLILAKSVMSEKTAVVLFSDGLPNDGGFERRLNELTLKAQVYAVGIGFDADYIMLERFTKEKKNIIDASDTYHIAEYLITECNKID